MLKLRELCREDIPEINSWRADRGMIDCLGAPYRYIGLEIDEEWFDSYLKRRANTVRCAVVEDTNPDEILGLATLANIDWVHRSCIFHIMIGEKAQGKGVGTFSLREMVRHAFFDLGLNRIELSVLEDNARAIKLYEKCGFVYEGRKRAAAFKNGTFKDMLMMSLLRDDWDGVC